jgi:NADH-quinone oxidoreductase subunit J
MNVLFFWFFSICMLAFAAAVIFNRNAVASALCFTFSIIFMAGLFVMLNAFFLAAVQILVTAGAVMVLFLFIVMLLDVSAMEHAPRHWIWTVCSGLLAVAFLGLVAKTLHSTPTALNLTQPVNQVSIRHAAPNSRSVTLATTQADWDRIDDTHRIGELLFRTRTQSDDGTGRMLTSYVAPFEITSLLILVATVGVIVLCKHDDRPRPGPREQINREAPPVEPRRPVASNR